MTGLGTSAIQRRIKQQCKQPSGEIAVSDSQATKPAAATDAGRNPIYEGQFDGETPEQAAHRLHWAKAGLAMGRDVAADQHARDIAVLRRLCAERDQLRAELAALKAQHEQDAQTIKVLQAMARQLKAQPSGVVLPEPLKAAIMRADDVLHALAGWDSSSVKLEQRHGADWLKEIDAIRRELHTQLARLNHQPASVGVDERAAFEAWVKKHNLSLSEDEIDQPEDINLDKQAGVYIWANAESAWLAWQARAALAEIKP